MGYSTTSSAGLSTLLFIPCLLLLAAALADAATFTVTNQCSFTVWAAAVASGGQKLGSGGQKLGPGATWTVTAKPGTTGGRIWARTGCSFDASGKGHCQTGDCGGVLACTAYGVPPNTLAEFGLNQFSGLDFFDISLVDGFNVPMNFLPDSGKCTKGPHCAVNVAAQCPSQLRAPGGCNNPCTVFKTDQYCCNSGSCSPTNYSKFFKNLCPEAYSYPKDDASSTFTCPGGTNYKVVFCPRSSTNDLMLLINSIVV